MGAERAVLSPNIAALGTYAKDHGPRPDMLGAKRRFEENFYEAVLAGLEQAEKVREGLAQAEKVLGKSVDEIETQEESDTLEAVLDEILEEIYPVNANPVDIGSGKVGVEIFIKRRAAPDLIEGFDGYAAADQWIRENADAYAVKKGAPAGIKVPRVGYQYK